MTTEGKWNKIKSRLDAIRRFLLGMSSGSVPDYVKSYRREVIGKCNWDAAVGYTMDFTCRKRNATNRIGIV